jgi:hypothetical protein
VDHCSLRSCETIGRSATCLRAWFCKLLQPLEQLDRTATVKKRLPSFSQLLTLTHAVQHRFRATMSESQLSECPYSGRLSSLMQRRIQCGKHQVFTDGKL